MRYLPLIILIWGCSPAWHLKKAIKKGAKVTTDSVYVDVVTERTITDTVALLSEVTKHDTITINTEKWKTKTVIRKDTIWQEVECKPDTITVKVSHETIITAPQKHPWYVKYVLFPLALFGLLAAIALVVRR
jgi:hypothetical protein